PFHPASDVFGPAVRVTGADEQLLGMAEVVDRSRRQDLELFGAGIIRPGRRSPGTQPLSEDPVVERAGREADAALVGDRPGRFRQNQAAPRVRKLDAPAAVLLDDIEVVSGGIVTAQGELEAALSGECAVASPGVAAELRKHRLDVNAKAPRKG